MLDGENTSAFSNTGIKIAGESFFDPPPTNTIPLEEKLVPLDKSIIWEFNNVFWKHYRLWEKTYGEHYESSLPAGISESHRTEFIENSTKRFIKLVEELKKQKSLPKIIYVYEEGPGSGLFAKGFLDNLKILSPSIYKNTIYLASDMSREMLSACSLTLTKHIGHSKLYTQNQFETHHKKYLGKILFTRHSNMWDQFQCRYFQKDGSLFEIYVRAVAPREFDQLIKVIEKKGLERTILKYPYLWKNFFRSIKLETKKVKSKRDLTNKASPKYTIQFLQNELEDQKALLSESVIDNLKFLTNLIDWKRNGYIEIVDLISNKIAQDARLLKFDGAISYKVNGRLVADWVERNGKQITFHAIRKLNTMIAIKNKSFKNALSTSNFLTISEIAAKKENNSKFIVEKSNEVLEQADFVTFSDMAHGLPDFLPIQKLLSIGVFPQTETNRLLCVFAARRKTRGQIPEIIKKLKKQGIENLIVVTGDPRPKGVKSIESGLTSLDMIPILSQNFFTGAVCNARVTEIGKTKRKIAAGAKFLIVQATFNTKEWKEWIKAIKKEKLNEQVAIIPALIPLTTLKTVEAIASLPDIELPEKLTRKFTKLSPDLLFEEGVKLVEDMLKEYKNQGIFSGVYIYSKNPKIVDRLTKIAKG